MKVITTEERLIDIFSDIDKHPDFPIKEITKKVAIVSTPRCGSSMFCDVLRNTDRVGDPKEWINKRYLSAYSRYFGINIKDVDFSKYLDFIFRKTTTSNGIFSINFHIYQYAERLKYKFDAFSLNFYKAYYLYRKEKIDQAYSNAKAAITDQWSSDANNTNEIHGEIERSRILQELLYISNSDIYYIKNIRSHINREYFYEDFSSLETTSAFTEILSDLEITDFSSSWASSMKKQRTKDDLSEITKLKKYLSPTTFGHE